MFWRNKMPDLNELIAPYIKEDADVESILGNVSNFIEAQKQESTSNLYQHKETILAEKKKLKEEFDELHSKYSWMESLDEPLTQESFADLRSQLDTLQTNLNQSADEISQKLDQKYQAGKEVAAQTWQPKLTALETDLKGVLKERDKYKSQFENFQVENKLMDTLSKLGVQSDNFLFAGLKASAQPQFGENGLESLTLPDANGNMLPLEDWGKYFVNSPEGKARIPAGHNTGAGAVGSGAGGGGIPSMEQIAKEPNYEKRVALMEKYGYIK